MIAAAMSNAACSARTCVYPWQLFEIASVIITTRASVFGRLYEETTVLTSLLS
jgi:hypothetical protein